MLGPFCRPHVFLILEFTCSSPHLSFSLFLSFQIPSIFSSLHHPLCLFIHSFLSFYGQVIFVIFCLNWPTKLFHIPHPNSHTAIHLPFGNIKTRFLLKAVKMLEYVSIQIYWPGRSWNITYRWPAKSYIFPRERENITILAPPICDISSAPSIYLYTNILQHFHCC